MQNDYTSARLLLNSLSASDAAFMRELVNTPGWLQFIGNRNVNNEADALAYIGKILDNPNATYWVVRLEVDRTPIGVITLIQRDYLPQADIGFAFQPAYSGHGYAYEAAKTIFDDIAPLHEALHAITIRENSKSIALLEKLGFHFDRELAKDEETLLVYTCP